MKRKLKIGNILILILVTAMVGVGLFLILDELGWLKSWPEPTRETPSPTATPSPQSINWEKEIPAIRQELGPKFLDVTIEESDSLSIFEQKDITGDNIPEALVNLGAGGAYTSYMTLMRLENDRPVIAQFKQADGALGPLMFLAGGSVMNGEGVALLPDKTAIYSGHWSRAAAGDPFGGLTDCGVEAYQWNGQTKIFEYNQVLSAQVRPDFCRQADSM